MTTFNVESARTALINGLQKAAKAEQSTAGLFISLAVQAGDSAAFIELVDGVFNDWRNDVDGIASKVNAVQGGKDDLYLIPQAFSCAKSTCKLALEAGIEFVTSTGKAKSFNKLRAEVKAHNAALVASGDATGDSTGEGGDDSDAAKPDYPKATRDAIRQAQALIESLKACHNKDTRKPLAGTKEQRNLICKAINAADAMVNMETNAPATIAPLELAKSA